MAFSGKVEPHGYINRVKWFDGTFGPGQVIPVRTYPHDVSAVIKIVLIDGKK